MEFNEEFTSSSLFVCFGVKLTAADQQKLLDEEGYGFSDIYFVDDANRVIGDSIGDCITSVDDDGVQEVKLPDYADLARRLTKILNRKILVEDIKIFTVMKPY